jgi:hypothetical protein
MTYIKAVTVHLHEHSNDKNIHFPRLFSVGSRHLFTCFREHEAWIIYVEKYCFESQPELNTTLKSGVLDHVFVLSSCAVSSQKYETMLFAYFTHDTLKEKQYISKPL